MTSFERALFYSSIAGIGLTCLVVGYRRPYRYIGVDEQGAYLRCRGQRQSLRFIRVNGVQLIAQIEQKRGFVNRFWPAYLVIFRGSVSNSDYQLLRSYAAQQIMLNRSEEAKLRRNA